MPASVFFRQLGLFVIPDFLDREYCHSICRHIAAAPTEEARVDGSDGDARVNLNWRKASSCTLPEEFRIPLHQRLQELKPALEKHFDVTVAGCETPDYLMYHPGDFFKMHQDAGGHGAMQAMHPNSRRRVSVVIFLNRQSKEPAPDAYGEGSLTFYGLLQGPQWEKCAFPLEAEPGLLIAFPSDKWHEVKPVTHGRRFTVVSWFYAPEGSELAKEVAENPSPAVSV